MLLENIRKSVENIESNLTLKSDYTEELQKLDNLKSDLAVAQHLNCDLIKIKRIYSNIKQIQNWCKEEIKAI